MPAESGAAGVIVIVLPSADSAVVTVTGPAPCPATPAMPIFASVAPDIFANSFSLNDKLMTRGAGTVAPSAGVDATTFGCALTGAAIATLGIAIPLTIAVNRSTKSADGAAHGDAAKTQALRCP